MIHAFTDIDQRRPLQRSAYLLLYLVISLVVAACENTTSEEEADRLATAYAEKLIIESSWPNDSVRAEKAVDSMAQVYGFDDNEDLLTELANASKNTDILRTILDSTQRRLDAIGRGALK
jgi:hypothetical protein